MPLYNMAQLATLLAPGDRLLGIDPGKRQIGIALSDAMRGIASPYAMIKRDKFAIIVGQITAIMRKEQVGGMVVGLPLSMDGSFGPAAQAARDWAASISDATGLPTALWDERLSSSAVNRALTDEADMSRKRRAELVDKLAAAYILQGALDFVRAAEAASAEDDYPV